MKGTLNTAKTWNGISESEKYSTHRENQFRSENGLPLRTHYSLIETSPNVYKPDSATRIIDVNGNSIFHFKQSTVNGKTTNTPYNYRKR